MKELIIFLTPFLLLACNSETTNELPQNDQPTIEQPVEQPIENETLAMVDEVEVQILESDPVQINAVLKGNFRNGCEKIDKTKATHLIQEKTFEITLTTREDGEMCTQALVPFEETVSLPTQGIKSGSYTVTANGVSETFEL